MAWAAREQHRLPPRIPSPPQATPPLPEQGPGGAQVCPPPLQHTTLGNGRYKKESTGPTERVVGQGTSPPVRGEEPELLAPACPRQLDQPHHMHPLTQKQDEK